MGRALCCLGPDKNSQSVSRDSRACQRTRMPDEAHPPTPPPSAALLAANARLLALRESLDVAAPPPFVPDAAADPAPSQPTPKPTPFPLPSHLGWESEAVTQVVRKALARREKGLNAAAARYTAHLPPPTHSAPPVPSGEAEDSLLPPNPAQVTIKLYPSLALAMLKQEKVACGRVWLLLRSLDKAGRGWLAPDEVRRALTDEASPFFLCGERQLRKLLAQGDGLFWQRDEAHIWLMRLVRVAAALGVEKLVGKPVALPLKLLLGPIGTVRAHLYASFHSGRTQTERTGSRSSPISRATLTDLSGVSPRTQQTYERKANVTVKRNLAVGSAVGAVCAQEQAWQHGKALFPFTDFRGRQGKAGQTYHAWQLPNNYFGPHAHTSRGRVRHHNRQLADLRQNGDAGNGQRSDMMRRYYANASDAEKGWRRCGRVPVYWPGKKGRGVVLWWVMEEPV